MEEEQKQINTFSFVLPDDIKLKERARRVLSLKFEHPDWTGKQIAETIGISSQRVYQILSHPRVLAAMPIIARQQINGMVPEALHAYKQLIKQNDNLQVKEKAASRILSDKKVFDAPTINVVGQITLKSVCELQEIVSKAANNVGNDIVDGELVDESMDIPSNATHLAIRPPSTTQ